MSYDCYCDYDAPMFYNEHKPVARKRHKCDECSGYVEIGERYQYVVGLWDGYFCVWKTCQRCYAIAMWVKNNVPCLCWMHGNLIEECDEAIDAAFSRAPKETMGLRFGYLRRRIMRDRWNREHTIAVKTAERGTT